MDLESIALLATLSTVSHQLAHMRDNAKSQRTKDLLAPLISALTAAIAGLASS